MTSLALANTTHPVAPFNGLFYATCATIIPVLFLALAVQGNVYEELLKAPAKTLLGMTDDLLRYARAPSVRNLGPLLTAALLNSPLMLLAVGIVTFGVIGEAKSLLALYSKQAVGGPAEVLVAALFLAAAAAAGPIARLLRLFLWVMGLAYRMDQEAAAENGEKSAAADAAASAIGWLFRHAFSGPWSTPPPAREQPPRARPAIRHAPAPPKWAKQTPHRAKASRHTHER